MESILKKIIFLFLLISLSWKSVIIAQESDSCLKLLVFPENSGNYNYDSIQVDSCYGSPSFGQKYVKQFFFVDFQYNVLPRAGIFPKDTIIEYTWHEIDSEYVSTKSRFQQLESKFGNFWFRESEPWRPDTSDIYWRQLLIRFENYVNLDSVIDFLKYITYVKYCDYIYNTLISVPEQSKFEKSNSILIFPQPANEFVYLKGMNINKSCNFEIISLNGLVLKSFRLSPEQVISINTYNLSSGLFFIKLDNIILPLIISK